MTTRVALIGSGLVGAVHAANLTRKADVELTAVYSPNPEKASAFASAHGVKHISKTLADAVAKADIAIICSPSEQHFQQALECLEAGVHTLVELPPCGKASEAEQLADSARKRGLRLGCAHTSRYLLPYVSITSHIQNGVIGEIREVNYIRHHRLRKRSWTDNALLHHAAHAIDLLLYWCGGLEPKGCIALPDASTADTVALLGKLPSGGPATITVSYASHLPDARMSVVGKNHTVETDGFTYLRSDLAGLQFRGIEREVYEQAIADQDDEFLRACNGDFCFVAWDETLELIRTVNQFEALCDEGYAGQQ